MPMIVNERRDDEEELTPAEKAIVTGLPPMLERQFEKLLTILFATGVMKVEPESKSLSMDAVVDAFYTALVGIGTMKGHIDADKAQARINNALKRVMESTSFYVSREGGGDGEGCGEPDCPACGSASDETEEKSKAAPPGVTKH